MIGDCRILTEDGIEDVELDRFGFLIEERDVRSLELENDVCIAVVYTCLSGRDVLIWNQTNERLNIFLIQKGLEWLTILVGRRLDIGDVRDRQFERVTEDGRQHRPETENQDEREDEHPKEGGAVTEPLLHIIFDKGPHLDPLFPKRLPSQCQKDGIEGRAIDRDGCEMNMFMMERLKERGEWGVFV